MIDTMNFWSQLDVLPVAYAALLVLGYEPFDQIDKKTGRQKTLLGFLSDIAMNGTLKTSLYELIQYMIKYVPIIEDVGVKKTTKEMLSSWDKVSEALMPGISKPSPLNHIRMKVEDIKRVLTERKKPLGLLAQCGTHIPINQPEYMNPNHPRFSPALCATVKAWLANENNALRTGEEILVGSRKIRASTIKGSSMVWVYNHSKELGLDTIDKRGKPEKISGTLLENIGTVINPPSQKSGGNPRKKPNIP